MARSRSYIAVPPGAMVREQLNTRGMSQKEFAVRMSMSEKHISKLINGDVQLTPEVAVRLELVLGVPASYWNSLEAVYREKLIKAEAENEMGADAVLAERFPYEEMLQLGWVPAVKTTFEKVIALRKFFGVVELSLLNNDQIMRIACRRPAMSHHSDLCLMAWAQEARILAREIETRPLNANGILSAVPEIRTLLSDAGDRFPDELLQLLSRNGVAVVFVPELMDKELHGVLFPDGNRAVLGLSEETDMAHLKHSVFHALAHIVLGHVGKSGGASLEDEQAADEWTEEAETGTETRI